MSKATKTLTDRTIQNLQTPPGKAQAEFYDRLVPGFGVRVGSGGAKAFFLFVRVLQGGKWKPVRVTIGRHPAISLSDARERAREFSALAAAGKDPRRAKEDKARALVDASRDTFGALAATFLETGRTRGTSQKHGPWRPKTATNYALSLSYFDHWADRPVVEIDKRMVQEAIDDIAADVGDRTAHNARGTLGAFFSWLVRRDVVDFSPVVGVDAPAAVSRDRHLNDVEIKAIWNACIKRGGPAADAFRLLLLTGQRRREIELLEWDEVDLEKRQINLSGERTKNGLPHVVPLSALAVEIIEAQEQRGQFVFTTSGRIPAGGYGKVKEIIAELSGVGDFRLHDLRRTMVTHMNEMDIRPHVIEAIVNHVSGASRAGVAGVYNKAQYLPAREAALNAWADKIERLAGGDVGGDVGGNVVTLGATA